MKINTYLTFDGNGQQAMEFYKQCLGADMFVMKEAAMYEDGPITHTTSVSFSTVQWCHRRDVCI